MQVAHTADFITHAVIGGGQSIDFGISNSAEFFNILSSTLYKDQKLAVVREVLCNAWDAHIEAGCTDRPVAITLKDGKLTVRDFGTGIHHDDMGLIYGTYGNSTKKNDGKQTGGFGLGCKAPFAYTDHFEVQSTHNGTRTIYSLSKSSAQTNGKPAIVPIAQFPDQNSGLQVSIQIQEDDEYAFKKLVYRIARNGDMNMTFNDEPLKKLDFDTKKANYMVTAENDLLDTMTTVMVRYGNVVYPVDSAPGIQSQMNKVSCHLEKLKYGRKEFRLLLQAPPHSISVTPSRESLSMQEHTVKTLATLLDSFLEVIDNGFQFACNKFAEEIVVNAVQRGYMHTMLDNDTRLPNIDSVGFQAVLTDLDSMARRYMANHYPESFGFRKRDVIHRIRTLSAAGHIDRGLSQTYIRELERMPNPYQYSNWFARNITGPLLAKLQTAGMDIDRLSIYDHFEDHVSKRSDPKYEPVYLARYARLSSIFAGLAYFRKLVVVSTSGKDIKARMVAENHPIIQKFGKNGGFLFYRAGMKKAEREGALKFFKDAGYNVIDLTVSIDYEAAARARAANKAAPRKPKIQGLPALSGMQTFITRKDAAGVEVKVPTKSIDTKLIKAMDTPRVAQPEAAILVHYGKDSYKDRLDMFGEVASAYIAQLFGDKIAVANNSTAYDKVIAAGAVDFRAYVQGKVCEYVTNNLAIQEYWQFNPIRALSVAGLSDYSESYKLVLAIFGNEVLRNKFGIVNNMTKEEKMYSYLWDVILKHAQERARYDKMPEVVHKVYLKLKSLQIHPKSQELVNKFKDNPLLDHSVVNARRLGNIIAKKGHPDFDKAMQILSIIIN